MKFMEYYITDKEGRSNCIIRTFCKLFNKQYEEVKQELLDIANKLNYDSYAEIEVFEHYLKKHGYSNFDIDSEVKIKNLNLPIGKFAIFCYDKKEFYHMVGVIDNIIYDRNIECLDLYVISVYKQN